MNRERLKAIFHAPATGPAELMMAITMFAFGLPFLCQWTEDLSRLPGYRPMLAVMPGTVWGVMLVAGGLWRCFEACGGPYRWRVMATAMAVFVWSVLFLSFLLGNPRSPGVTVFGAWVVLELWTLFRIRRMV